MSEINMQEKYTTEQSLAELVGRPRVAVMVGVAVLALLGWIYLAAMVADMVPNMDMAELGPGMEAFNAFNLFNGLDAKTRAMLAAICLPNGAQAHFGMPGIGTWSTFDLGLVFFMWLAMSAAMMLPTAAPMILTYAGIARRETEEGKNRPSALYVALGYLTIWGAYSLFATLVQWGLTELGLMSAMMAPLSIGLAVTALIGAGIYQFTPAKQACLIRCQTPISYMVGHMTSRISGVYKIGLEQGLFCLGCCWALMTVMFAVGVMNVIWIAILALIMGLEKTVYNPWLTRVIGIGLIAWGLGLLFITGYGQIILERLALQF